MELRDRTATVRESAESNDHSELGAHVHFFGGVPPLVMPKDSDKWDTC
jgi:hypothetical protein